MRTGGGFAGLLIVLLGCTEVVDGPECGEGTVMVDGECVLDPNVCGSGTHFESGMCVPDPPPPGRYELRVVMSEVRANGYSKFPVLAIGTDLDGTPSTEDVVFNVDRAGAGTYTTPAMTLGPLGATSYFVPCNAATPGCTGPVALILALASAPDVPVASVDVELVMPEGVGTAAPCLVGGNVMHFDGSGYIYTGMLTVTAGDWTTMGSDDDYLMVRVTPSAQGQGAWWYHEFDASELDVPLVEGVYDMATRYPFQLPGRPGMSIHGDGRGCNTLTGRFEVHEHTRDANGVVAATVSFQQYCGGSPTDVLNGCVHYAR